MGSLDSCVCRSVFIMESLVLPMVGIVHSRDVQLTHELILVDIEKLLSSEEMSLVDSVAKSA